MNGGCVVQLRSVAACRGVGLIGLRLRAIGGSGGEDDKSRCTAAQEDTIGFYEFPFDLY